MTIKNLSDKSVWVDYVQAFQISVADGTGQPCPWNCSLGWGGLIGPGKHVQPTVTDYPWLSSGSLFSTAWKPRLDCYVMPNRGPWFFKVRYQDTEGHPPSDPMKPALWFVGELDSNPVQIEIEDTVEADGRRKRAFKPASPDVR